MVKIISLANQKGGVGKTTTTVNMGAVLSYIYKKKVLLVDIDSQGNMSDAFKIDIESKPTIYEVLSSEASIVDAIHTVNGIDIIASDITLANAEREFTQIGSEHHLRKALSKIENNYDYVLIDCPPSLGILTINAFTYSDEVIITIKPAFFSLKGLVSLNDTIMSIKEYTNERIVIAGVLFTEHNDRFNIYQEMKKSAEEISTLIHAPIFNTYIRSSITVVESQAAGQDLLSFNKSSTSEEDYITFVDEYLKKEGK